MVAKLLAVEGGVSKLEHTDQEIQDALKEIQALDPGKKRCKQAGLLSYLRNNPDDAYAFAKGHDKDIILAKFHILQLRSANSRNTTETDKGFKKKNSILHTLHWYSEEQGEKTFGFDKWHHWCDSGLLPERPDRVTGSTLPRYIERGAPDDYEQYSKEDWRTFRQRCEEEMEADEAASFAKLEELGSMGPSAGTPSTSTPKDIEIKIEKKVTLRSLPRRSTKSRAQSSPH